MPDFVDPLLQGLKLHQPKSLLFPSNYATTLLEQPKDSAYFIAGIGLLLLFLGLPLRRVTAAVLLGALAWFLAGAIAMNEHWPFALTTLSAGLVAAALGVWLPRLAIPLATSFPLAICARSAMLYFAAEYALWAMLGTFVFVWLVGSVLHRFWAALSAAAVGAFLLTCSLSALLSDRFAELAANVVDQWIVLYALTFMVATFAGMAVQLGIGEWKLKLPKRSA